jgi:hypothetical protein
MCPPNYDGQSIFAALLDAANDGYWKLGARGRRFGRRQYLSCGPLLQTTWEDRDYSLDLLDFMPWPLRSAAAATGQCCADTVDLAR